MALGRGGIVEGMVEVPDGQVWFQRHDGGGAGIPLLCLHGGPGMPHDYLEPLAGLADERPVVFYDQLGCGRSPVQDHEIRWTVARFVVELDAVRRALGLANVVIFGNSWGGMLAMRYMLGSPVGVAGLILSSAPPSVSRWLADANGLRAALPRHIQDVLRTHEESGFYGCPEYQGAVAEFYRRHLCRLRPWPECVERTFAGLGVEAYSEMWGPSEFGPVTGSLRDWELLDQVPRIAVPTLVTCGRFDEATPEHMAALAEALPDAELAIFESSSHMAFLEERDLYLGRLRSFVRRFDQYATDDV